MRILATPDEISAVGDAIAHYLTYIQFAPDMTKEQKEMASLLAHFQTRLAHPSEEDEKGIVERFGR